MIKTDNNQPVYVISVAARLAQVHPRTLRIYEEFGLLTPSRTEGNIRLYSQKDITVVRHIRYLTQTRCVNLAGVKIILKIEERYGINLEDED
ncbi:MAG TPA: MerR family DNA-binding transcriptional regulator [Desulfotomaculum sp.]|nr:MAG: Putative transcriptional regulator, MerR family [Desulfotomaculum sp. 46_80]HAG10338.1 MerR family DNA-binding transcriptional regulator [Desulfotomaculum sp.]HBY04127.1 MerR family DNA-binding transcriptional regulator [Desulfotomaculum sp.]